MTKDRSPRFDRVLPGLFEELADARTPAYLEVAIERASSRPQRPAWTIPGRWIPMADIATTRVPVARAQWRSIVVLAVITLLIAMLLTVYIGSQQRRLPKPFGPAGNGVIALAQDGDIVTVDPATGAVSTIVGGPETDAAPVYSPNGTRIGFERGVAGRADQRLLMVSNADGSGLVQATPEPLSGLGSWSFSPDGRELLVTASIDGQVRIAILTVDGSREPQLLDVSLPAEPDRVEAPSYRPPDGREILVVATQPGRFERGIYVVDVESGQTRPVVEPTSPNDVSGASWSPDGDWIAYGQHYPADIATIHVHVVAADGTGDRLVDTVPGTAYDSGSTWSNDSTRLLLVRGYAPDGSAEGVAVVALDRATPSVELDCRNAGLSTCVGDWRFSPDDTQLLGAVGPGDRYLMADPRTGTVTEVPWSATGQPSWQRLAPPG